MKRQTKENMKETLFHISKLAVVPKTDDEIYVSVSIGKYIIIFHLFFVLCQRSSCCWKYRKWGSYLENCYH